MVGISFDSPEDNAAFVEANNFPFVLLSDVDRVVGGLYQATRDAGEQYGDYPRRLAYLIDPDGKVASAEEVANPDGYGAKALNGLAAAQR